MIAHRIRLERDLRGWSQGELAGWSGVSKATVSKIEREEMSPTAVILLRIAGAFDLTLAGLLLRAEGGGGRISRVSEQPEWRDPETGYVRKQVFVRPDHPLEIADIELPPKRRVVLPASSYLHIRQVILVRSGRLTVLEGGERWEMVEGDCLGFGAPSEVTIINETYEVCKYVVALSRG